MYQYIKLKCKEKVLKPGKKGEKNEREIKNEEEKRKGVPRERYKKEQSLDEDSGWRRFITEGLEAKNTLSIQYVCSSATITSCIPCPCIPLM